MQDQTHAEEEAQEAREARRNALARRERDLERGLLAASREKAADEPGDGAGMRYGYVRVSSRDQNTALQHDALSRAGVEEIHEEMASGVKARPVLDALLARLGPGDSLTTWKLDRIGRSARQTLQIIETLRDRGATYRSITEGLDTATAFGRLGITILAAVAEMERDVLLERIYAGIAISRAEGRHGRRPGYDIARVRHARDLIAQGSSVRQASRAVGIARSTLADAIQRLPPGP